MIWSLHICDAHIAAGAKAVQVFDSWVGALSPADFEVYVLPTMMRIFKELSDLKEPKIYFPGVSSGELLPYLDDDPSGCDWSGLACSDFRRTERLANAMRCKATWIPIF